MKLATAVPLSTVIILVTEYYFCYNAIRDVFMQLHLPLAFKQVDCIENTPTPEALKLKLAVKSRFVCVLICSTTDKVRCGPMAGQQKRQIYIRFYYTMASSMKTDP